MSKKTILFFFAILLGGSSMGQSAWSWFELPSMPMRTSNNAVSQAKIGNLQYVYSFGGIDSTKQASGIHQKSFRYDASAQVWTSIPDVPDTLGKIAMAATNVNGVIYVMGGYHVLQNGSEVSSNRVHRFDPVTNNWLSDGAPIPKAIDDHVQIPYKDSLIYVITGWSNTANQPDVQIYNTYTDTWSTGTSVPNNNNFISFGASGTIVGDTIYYNGGVAGTFTFTNRPYLRKGVIDPNDPTQITWTQEMDNPGDPGYRMGVGKWDDRIFWFDGAGTAYNYDGIAYNGSGGVEPLTRVLTYDASNMVWYAGSGAPYGVMDIRGQANFNNQWVLCGGMDFGQYVTDRVLLLLYDTIAGAVFENEYQSIVVYPNPTSDLIRIKSDDRWHFRIIDAQGRIVREGTTSGEIKASDLQAGSYVLYLRGESGVIRQSRVVVQD